MHIECEGGDHSQCVWGRRFYIDNQHCSTQGCNDDYSAFVIRRGDAVERFCPSHWHGELRRCRAFAEAEEAFYKWAFNKD